MRHACCVFFATAVMFNSCNAFACMVTLGSRKVVSAQLLQASTTKIYIIYQNMAIFITSMHVAIKFFPASSHLWNHESPLRKMSMAISSSVLCFCGTLRRDAGCRWFFLTGFRSLAGDMRCWVSRWKLRLFRARSPWRWNMISLLGSGFTLDDFCDWNLEGTYQYIWGYIHVNTFCKENMTWNSSIVSTSKELAKDITREFRW